MLELLLCSLLTILPDYLYRRYAQGKRFGNEITLYSVWFELRWGIISLPDADRRADHGDLLLPSVDDQRRRCSSGPCRSFRRPTGAWPRSMSASAAAVEQGAPIFRLDSSKQEAAAETARRKIAEVDAALAVAQADIAEATKARSRRPEAPTSRRWTSWRPSRSCSGATPTSWPCARSSGSQVVVEGRTGAPSPPRPRRKQAAETRISSVLPAEKASAQAALAQAQVELDKTVIRAGVSGHIEQFALRVGDIVNPFMRPAGILIPEGAGRAGLQAGFGQIEAQVMKVGMIAEVTCVSKPWTIIPMVVTEVQDFIAAGQFRGGEQLIDAQQVARPGTLLVFLEPLYEGGLTGVTPGQQLHRQRLHQQPRPDRIGQS